MKPQTFTKKLNLSKATVSTLNGSEMKQVGGADPSKLIETCYTCPWTYCEPIC